jgi:signal transduction histidine kinase
VQPISDADAMRRPSGPTGPSSSGVSGVEMAQVAALCDLAALLVRGEAAADLLGRALELGARLVPAVAEWRVYGAGNGAQDALYLLAQSVARPGSTESDKPASLARRVTTLGFGAGIDHLVLDQHGTAYLRGSGRGVRRDKMSDEVSRPEGDASGLVLPLIDAGGALRGVLVALAPAGGALRESEQRLVQAVAHDAAALLARREPESGQASTTQQSAATDERMAFISLAAHELRSPLTSVKGYAQLLLRSARKDPAYPQNSLRALQSIEQQASRMSDMVAELLDASRIERGVFEVHPRPTELIPLVERVVEQRRPSLEQHTLRLEPDEQVLRGNWDAVRVEQVVRDLLDNAIRYSPEGGEVLVRITHADGEARVCVRDEGVGVAEDERERIFGVFYRGAITQRRNLAGLGLGLFVSRTIAERLGGRLWLDTSDATATGSVFCLALPLAADATLPPA